jgi:hypothetical protein
MQTLEIDLILDQAYHKAAGLAACEVRRHLRPFNLRRHPITVVNDELTFGGRPWYDFSFHNDLSEAICEAGRYVRNLPLEVIKRLKDHL